MDNRQIGNIIMKKRKESGFTQQELADKLNISFQAVSKWETGAAYPDIELLPLLAAILGTTVDALLGYNAASITYYEERYKKDGYYWGLNPNYLCYEVMKLKPPTQAYRLLDIGCGEGKDAVFFARNGYLVTAFDAADSGLAKARKLAENCGVHVDFFKADINDYRLEHDYDIIFSSGVFHFLRPQLREEFTADLKEHTVDGGLNVINVFVEKAFIAPAPDSEETETAKKRWKSGELFMCYHDWKFHTMDEFVFDCNSGGVPHKHCMDVMIAERV